MVSEVYALICCKGSLREHYLDMDVRLSGMLQGRTKDKGKLKNLHRWSRNKLEEI